MSEFDDNARLISVIFDDSIARSTLEIEHEREVAIFDLLADNHFFPHGDVASGPYHLKLSLLDKRLIFEISRQDHSWVTTHILSLTPFRRIIKDYFFVCESYYEAIRLAAPSKIEAIDMGRRGLHNEGSHILLDRLKGKIEMDFKTARRLFTLLYVLHWQG